MQFSELVRGVCLRVPVDGGDAVGAVDRVRAARFGRALATLLVRRQLPCSPVVLARTDDGEAQRALRDGFVRGLVSSGADVLDLGRAASELFAFGLRAGHDGRECAAGVLLGSLGEATSVMTFVGLSPTSAATLEELAQLADDGVFVVGAGRVSFPDLRAAFRAEAGDSFDISFELTDDDTREGPAL
ncbi:MAG: hypothetical protein FJ137_07770 [Deltaproteobacteria bacterium]|nr:hypothetical protein [Deltaproteobacteria bacterium]